MRKGLQAFRRKHVRHLLLGVLGGAIGSGGAMAAGPDAAGEPSASRDEAFPALRLSPTLGERRTPARARPALATGALGRAEMPLRLSLLLGARPDAKAGVVAARAAESASGGGPGRVIAARISGSPGEHRDDDDRPLRPEAPVPFDPRPAGGAARRPLPADVPASGTTRTVESGLPDLSGETWTIAPIRWGGNTGTAASAFGTSGGGKNLSIQNSLNLNASSFIGAPYIAQWSGSLGTVSANNWSASASGPSTRSESSTLNLGGTLNLFSLSNFPFSATISRSSSELRAGGEMEPATTFSLGLRQQYRSTDARDNYSASYNRNSFTSGARSSVTSALLGSFSTHRAFEDEDDFWAGEHTLSANFGISPTSSSDTGENALAINASANHGWTVHEDLSINSFMTFASSQSNFLFGDTRTRSNSTIFLGSSTFAYNVEDLPITLTGGVNLGLTQADFGGQQNSLQNLGGHVSGQYRFSKNLLATGNASLSSTLSAADRNTFGAVSANVSYTGDPIWFGQFNYGWSAGGGANASYTTTGNSSTGFNATASHNLNRNFVIGDAQMVNLSASQNVSINQAQSGQSASLSNNLGASWGARFGDALSANLGASVSDTISTGTGQLGANHYRAMNLTGSGSWHISSRAALTLNSNLNWSQSVSGAAQSQEVSGIVIDNSNRQVTGSFSLGYTHSNPFSIRNLNYTAQALLINSETSQRLSGVDPLSSQARNSASLQQNIDYRIGRLAFRLNVALIEQGGRKSASIFGSVNREFGGLFDGRW